MQGKYREILRNSWAWRGRGHATGKLTYGRQVGGTAEGMAGEQEWREQDDLRGPSRLKVRQVRQIQRVSGER
ncbi:hypothetical protein TH8_05185 [Thalassospira profundimaris]|nr:hypothetical protein TH8_05185 [Thalassospira profundimaris]